MKTRRKSFYTILLVVGGILWGACSKDEPDTLWYGVKYCEPVGATRVYTDGGRLITDEAARKNFLESYHPSGTNVSKQFMEFENSDFYAMALLLKNGEIIQCAGIDVIGHEKSEEAEIIRTTVKNEASAFDKRFFDSGVLKYDFYRPEEDGRQYYHMQYVIHKQKKRFEMSLISVKSVRWNEQEQKMESFVDFAYNELNEEFLSTLSCRDTLAVREYKIILAR